MATFTRKNAWNNNGTFDNPDLLWYAKAVQVMQSRPISDPTSWWFYAAIHGEYLLPASMIPSSFPDYQYLNWINISYIATTAKIDKIPAQKLTDLFWDQCQHATWYFLPWHRGYLVSIENILRDIIINQLKGPEDWALPYWNYLNQSTQNTEQNIPPAFTDVSLPDGKPNPLHVVERYGSIIEIGNAENSANDICQFDTIYSDGSSPAPLGPGDSTGYFYSGGETGFMHEGGSETGDIEMNPHNFVHGMVGGRNKKKQTGLMGVPNTAALDPVFYLHHANVDRMWAAWNETGKNENSSKPSWLVGPSAHGNSRFAMPLDLKGNPWFYTPADTQSTNNLKYNGTTYSYTYDDLSLTSFEKAPPSEPMRISERFAKLGIRDLHNVIKMTNDRKTELVGASSGTLKIKNSETQATVKLNTTAWESVSRSFFIAPIPSIPDEVFLQLEGVNGGSDSNFLSVYVNEKFVKSVSLFGLLSASMKNNFHGGAGLTFKFNITNIIDDLHLAGNIDIDSLNVQVKAKDALHKGDEITIDRIGVYRVSQ
ncbi:tyrosinase family protein [Spirosoma foliorum]|uniref:Tyrosinase family protein n=1 Tax=Spirosoma foliorum TaxID=2710596 RepID=A0A7G5H2T6_9BACT|nr:tyrosinase family protein [Spirosoma foliorum]QMW05428.1 tyrosinase family protein [Spirosoma foliorum]